MILKIEAEQRTTEKKSDLSKLRKNGYIPAVVYGYETEPLKISLVKADFMKLYKMSYNELVFYEIKYAGKEYHTLMKDRQIHPVTRDILHLDFMVIPPHQEIEVDVPLKFVGTAIGMKEGGILDIVQRTLKIQCVEEDIPEDIEVDISNLQTGEALHVYQLPQGKWTVKDNPDNALVTIHAKRIEVVAPPVEEEPKPEEAPEEEQEQQQ
jgi:large subunit ribosomal protein L25